MKERWDNIKRLYSPQDVQKLRGTVNIEYSLARQGAEKLWKYLNEDDFPELNNHFPNHCCCRIARNARFHKGSGVWI